MVTIEEQQFDVIANSTNVVTVESMEIDCIPNLYVMLPKLDDNSWNRYQQLIDADTAIYVRVDKVETDSNNNYTSLINSLNLLSDDVNSSAHMYNVLSTYFQDANSYADFAVATEASNRTSADSAISSKIDTVEANYKTADSIINASVTSEQTARVNADGAIATRIDTVEAEYKAADSINTAAITHEADVRADAVKAVATDVLAVTARVDTNEANITSEINARVDGESSIATRIDTVEAEYKTADSINTAAITNEQTARADADSALASDITTLKADVGNNTAAITTEQIARATETDALAQRTDVLEASSGNFDVSLTDTRKVVAGQFAVYSIDGVVQTDPDTGVPYAAPLVGMTKFIGNVQYQFLGGTLGENNDGWVRTDYSASDESTQLGIQLSSDISSLQNQVDGKVVTYFQDTKPYTTGTIAEDGDIWYDTSPATGATAYRFDHTSSTNDGWILIEDTKALEALMAASSAQSTADGKMTVYYYEDGDRPTTGVQVGDLNINPTTKIVTSWDGNAWTNITNKDTSDLKGWVATASSLVVDPNTGNVTGWQYGDGSGFDSVFQISADRIVMDGSVTFVSSGDNISLLTNNSGFITGGQVISNIGEETITSAMLGTTIVSGGYINTSLLTADNIQTGALSVDRIIGMAVGTSASSPNSIAINTNGSTYFGNIYASNQVYGKELNITRDDSTTAITGYNQSDGYGVEAISSTGHALHATSSTHAVHGDCTDESGQWGLITYDKAYIGGTVYPFTGTHFAYGPEDFTVGDIVISENALVINIDQTLVYCSVATTTKDKRVFGVVSAVQDNIIKNILGNKMYSYEEQVEEKLEDGSTVLVGNNIWHIKAEYESYINYMIDNNFKEVGVNALGEGGMNVCEVNGDILNGDYITSSGIRGKGMKQDDCLMHNYTVAKALESVIWSNETVGEHGVFEQDGVLCKLISVSYHSA